MVQENLGYSNGFRSPHGSEYYWVVKIGFRSQHGSGKSLVVKNGFRSPHGSGYYWVVKMCVVSPHGSGYYWVVKMCVLNPHDSGNWWVVKMGLESTWFKKFLGSEHLVSKSCPPTHSHRKCQTHTLPHGYGTLTPQQAYASIVGVWVGF